MSIIITNNYPYNQVIAIANADEDTIRRTVAREALRSASDRADLINFFKYIAEDGIEDNVSKTRCICNPYFQEKFFDAYEKEINELRKEQGFGIESYVENIRAHFALRAFEYHANAITEEYQLEEQD